MLGRHADSNSLNRSLSHRETRSANFSTVFQFRPVARQRYKNRRIEIVLFPSEVKVVRGKR